MSEYKSELDGIMTGFWVACGVVVVAFALFIGLVVIPSNNDRHDRCEAAGGVLVGKYHDCIKKENVLKY